jgi:hypothetical protein
MCFASGGELTGQALSYFFTSGTREHMRVGLGSIIKATTIKLMDRGKWSDVAVCALSLQTLIAL